MLELGVPLRRSPDFQIVPFDQDVAVRAGLDDLMRLSFRYDIERYGYDAAPTNAGKSRDKTYIDKSSALRGLSAIEIDALLVNNKQLSIRCDQLQSRHEYIIKQNQTIKINLDKALVSPDKLIEWLLESNIPVLRGFLERKEINRLRKLNFDEDFYVAYNPDVGASRQDPVLHFVRHGRREGRQFRLRD